jgi:hypothetical protein
MTITNSSLCGKPFILRKPLNLLEIHVKYILSILLSSLYLFILGIAFVAAMIAAMIANVIK